MKEDLIKLGFSSNEADVYLALISLGKTGTGEIIKKTGLHRNIVYETLNKLITKKLATRVINKKVSQFLVTDPERILDEQKNNLELASQIIPSLSAQANVKQEIVIYEGLEGFQSFSLDYVSKMKENSTLYVLGAIGDRWFDLMGESYNKFERKRLKKKIWFKMIEYHESEMDKTLVQAGKYYAVRVIPQNLDTPANVVFWDEYVALQTLVEPYSVVQIKNAALAKSYLNYFNLLWNQGKDI